MEPLSNEKGPGNVEPHFLPPEASADSLLLSVGGPTDKSVYLWNVDSREAKMLTEGSGAVYAEPGFIIYQPRAQSPDLWALPFSLATLKSTGDAFPISQGVGEASVSSDGTLVSVDVSIGTSKHRLVWRDRTGKKTGEIGHPQNAMRYPALSPDGRRVVVRAHGGQGRALWLHDVDRPVSQRLTFEPGNVALPSWSADGKLIAYSFIAGGGPKLFVLSPDGSTKPEVLVESPGGANASHWSPDGRHVIYNVRQPETGFDLWVLDRQAKQGAGEAVPFLASSFHESNPQISPDGGYVAYCSNESGAEETYVRRFPSGAGRWQVSENGGCQPRWSRDGKELFYVEEASAAESTALMAVTVTAGSDFEIGRAQHLFSSASLLDIFWTYDVAADGRFVMIEEVEDDPEAQRKPAIHITQNWYEEFRDRE